MPSSKGSSNSNKTAHVMNLLRKNTPAPAARSAAPAVENSVAGPAVQVAQPAPQPTPAPQSAPAAPIITALNADGEIAMQIRDALAEELAQETENNASALSVTEEDTAHQPVPVLATEPLHTESAMPAKTEKSAELETPTPQPPASVQAEEVPIFPKNGEETSVESEDSPDNSSKKESVIQPVVQAEKPISIAEEAAASQDGSVGDRGPIMVNVMQKIVEDKVDKYIRLFGVCTCNHCRNDVMALALNHLPTKYVVRDPAELALKRDMYEVRYNCEIVAQLMQACEKVKNNPHHKM